MPIYNQYTAPEDSSFYTNQKKAGRLVNDLYLPPLQRLDKSLATNNNNKKAKILTERFFPQPALVDLSNITGKALVTCLRVDSDITTKEIAGTISRLLNNTVLGLDKILNKALKTYKPLIAL